MTFEQAKKNLLEKFKAYEIPEEVVVTAIKDTMESGSVTVDGAYNIIRMAWANALGCGQHEYFTIEDIMSITGETREKCIARIEEVLQVVEENGGNPDDYAIRVKPYTFYFPIGLK